ncbi:MAG: right-handed parallel beta-helix repeat-containing protein [archaeon]|nr:MAG: right-handed parallel beta-helix repeat-containing protein [archaeon]
MKKLFILIAIIIFVSILLGSFGTSTEVNSCQTISSPGYYNLTTNIYDYSAGQICMLITSDDVIFDGAYYTIDGDGGATDYAFYTENDNVTIENVTTTDWGYAVQILNGDNNTMQNLNISLNQTNGSYGIMVQGTYNNTVYNCSLDGLTQSGIYSHTSNFTNITSNTVTSSNNGFQLFKALNLTATMNNLSTNQFSVLFSYSNYSEIYNNTLLLSIQSGFDMDYSKYNNLTNNTINDSQSAAVQIENSDNNTFVNNTLLYTASSAFNLTTSNRNNITDNNVTHCGSVGFNLNNASNNNISVNNMTNLTTAGFEFNYSDYNTLFLNTITNLTSSAFSMNESDWNNITNTTLTNYNASNDPSGFNLNASHSNIINNNTMTNLTGGGIWFTDSNNNSAVRNIYVVPSTVAVAGFKFTNSNNTYAGESQFQGGREAAVSASSIQVINSTNTTLFNTSTLSCAAAMEITTSNTTLFKNVSCNCSGDSLTLTNSSHMAVYNSSFGFYETDAEYYYVDSNNFSWNNSMYNTNLTSVSRPNDNLINISVNGSKYDLYPTLNNFTKAGNISRFINLTHSPELAGEWVSLNITYLDSDLVSAYIANESTLRMMYYNNTNQTWLNVSSTNVDTSNNMVWSSLDSDESQAASFALGIFGDANEPPTTTLITPTEGQNFDTSQAINFSFNVTDDLNATLNCSLFLDAVLNSTNSSTSNATKTWINLTGVPYGSHNWSVNCTDGLNYNTTETRNFSVGSNVSCQDLDTAKTYILTQNLTDDDTCFTATVDNVVLNCDGYTVNYAQANPGFALTTMNDPSGLIVRNCNFVGGAQSTAHAIYLKTTTNANISDSNLTATGDGASGVYVNLSSSGTIIDNVMITTSGDQAEGIYIEGTSTNSNINNNNITTNNTNSDAIYIDSGSGHNITNNTLTGEASTSDAIQITDSGDCNITNNTLNVLADGSNVGIRLTGGSSNTILIKNNFTACTEFAFDSGTDLISNFSENDFNGTEISFSQYSGEIDINLGNSSLVDPTNYSNISKYVEITGPTWANITFHYSDSDLGSVNESTLQVFRHNGTDWENVTSGRDTTLNIVFANLTSFSHFAPMGGEVDAVSAPDNFSSYLINSTTQMIMVNWSEVSGASGYYIWTTDNATKILELNSTNNWTANMTMVGTSNTSWNDTTSNTTTKRFYSVSAFTSSLINISDNRVGKHSITVKSPDTNKTILSLPLMKNLTLSGITAPNNFAYVVSYDDGGQLIYRSYRDGNWYNETNDLVDLNLTFGAGYYFYNFDSDLNVTSVGNLSTGNVNQTVHGPDTNKTMLGWESYTDGNLSELISDTNDYAYVVSYTPNGSLEYRSFSNENIWKDDNNNPSSLNFTAGQGYYFYNFDNDVNLSYERNPTS